MDGYRHLFSLSQTSSKYTDILLPKTDALALSHFDNQNYLVKGKKKI